MDSISFTLPEMLSLLGMAQCVFLLVHILFQARILRRVFLPALYFLVLGIAFWADATRAHLDIWNGALEYMQWAGWFLGPPLSVLLIIQMSDMNKFPSIKEFWVVLLLPLSLGLSALTVDPSLKCSLLEPCTELKELLNVMGLMAGTISLLVIFSKKDLFKNVKKQKHGSERYWLVIALIALNALFLASVLAELMRFIDEANLLMLRTVFGLGFVYLISTSLLRLFPAGGKAAASNTSTGDGLSDDERAIAEKIEGLLNFEKVYQEPTYARSDLARECSVSEMLVSRVINVHFGKSFPQIMNERRIEDAKRLLIETNAAIKTIAEEVGFNSLPSFNRVFKDMVGVSPGEYRKEARQKQA